MWLKKQDPGAGNSRVGVAISVGAEDDSGHFQSLIIIAQIIMLKLVDLTAFSPSGSRETGR